MRTGAPAYGTKMADGAVVDHHAEQEIVALMIAARLTGRSFAAIASELQRAGVPTKRAGSWRPMTVRRILAAHGMG